MGGGGKGGTTTQTVSIPPEVLARYNAVNARAESVAQQPFQQYGGEFVAPLTPAQTAGIQGTNVAANQAQPYYGAATGAAFAGAMPVNPGGLQVGQYMNPFTQSVVGATQAAMGQQQGQQLAQQQAESIRAGAFGGDRAGLQRQALRGQQGLARAQAIAPLYHQDYQQALQTAQQQQGVGLGAAQANRQAVQQLSQQLGGLGTGAQQAALQGAQAQMAAGQVQQQTQQAQDTAQYQQFLQERGYPFQVAQFLANIAMGTGALSGSTTTTQQPGGFFSDKRLKKDVKEIGETHDGQPIYSYKYKGDDRTQIGLMAQDVEKKHPEAVGVMGGYKTVDYKKATEDAERTHKDMGGGLMPQMLTPEMEAGDTTPSVEMSGMTPENAAAAYNSSSPNPTSGWGPRQDTSVALRGSWRDLPASRLTNTPDDRNSSSSAAMWSAPGARYGRAMGGGLVPDGFDPNSMGGAVSPDMAGEAFMRGGYVGGGLVDANDWASIVAANKQALGVYGGAQPISGGSPGAMGGLNIPTSMATPKLITAGAAPQQKPSGMSTAMQTGKDIAGIYKGGKEFLYGSKADESSGLLGSKGVSSNEGWYDKAKDLFKAEGGLIVPRHAYADGGETDNEVAPYDPAETMRGEDPMKDVLASGSKTPQQLKAAQLSMGPNGQQGGGLLGAAKDVAGLFGTAKMLGEGASWLGSTAIPFLFAADGGRIPAYADGGLVPRQGYATRGGTDVPADYSPEADMPSPNAQEAARYSEEDLDRAARDALALQMRRESGGDPQARAKTSSAAGLYQITDPTAKGLIQRNPGLGIQYDPNIRGFAATLPREQQEALGLALSKEHVRTLAKQGFEPTPQNVSANWFLGGSGGPALLKAMQADPSMPATSVAGPDAIRANQTMFFKKDGSPRSVSEVYSMLNKTGGGAPVPPGLVGAGMQPAAPSTGAGEKKGFGDIITSEGFVVPALGFLGSMLASNRPNLGQALGEGIMGGVGAYQAQRKEIPATAKVVEETRAMSQKTDLELVDRLLKFNQVRVARGQPPITSLDEFKKKLADGSIIETPSQAGQAGQAQPPAAPQPGAAQPAAGAPSISTANDATERTLASPPVQQGLSQVDWSNVAPSHNIPQIQAEIETTKRLAETATDPATLQQLQEKQAILRKEIQEILKGNELVDKNQNRFVPPGWQKVTNQIESQKTKAVKDADAYAAMEQDLRANQSAVPGVQQKFENLGKILTNYQTGKAENFKTFVPAIAKAVGIQVDPDKIKTREDFEKFVKESRDLLFQQLKQVGGRILVTEVQRMQEAVVDPELQPGANRSLIASGKAATNYTQDFYDHYRGWKRDNPYATVDDFADMQREWQNKNKLQKYITEAEANTPVKGDFPPPDKRKNGYQYVVDTPGVRNLVVDGKRVAPNGYIGRWDSKANDFVIEKVL